MVFINIFKNIRLKIECRKTEELEGSFTVEASFVMPIVVFIVLTLIFLGYSLYDQCRWEERFQDGILLANKWVLHAAEFDTGRQDLDKINERGVFFRFFGGPEEAGELFENYVLSARVAFITKAEITKTEINLNGVHYEAVMERNIPDILIEFSSVLPQQRSGRVRLHHPAELVRGYAALDEIVENTKGLSKLKEEIKKLIN